MIKNFELKIDIPLENKLKERIVKNIKENGFNKGVAGILRLNEKYVFVINQKEPFNKDWIFVSGGVELGESPEEAISREIREETGLEIIKKEKIGMLILKNMQKSTIEVFDCVCSGEPSKGKNIKSIKVFDKIPSNLNKICKKILEINS